MTTKTETVIDRLENHIASECKAVDREAAFDDMLDECYSFDSVGGPFSCMSPSRVLRECDPVAHRCGVNDYADGMDWTEVGNETYQNDDLDKAKESFVEDLESEISELETDIEADEADEDHNVLELASLKRKLADLQADLKTIEEHSF